MADVSMEMKSWSGEWGLPSIDINCLEVLAYAKFSGCPLKVSKMNNPWKSPTWQLPMFTSDNKVLTSSRQIMDFLREKNFNADYQLTAKQGADTLAFMALIEERLNPALLHTIWVDIENYRDFTRALYAKRLPIPLSFLVPGQMARISKNTVYKGHFVDDDKEAAYEKKIFKDAMDCLNFLSIKLADKPFFFGESPTTLDAVAFAHLALIWRAPNLPNNKLKNHLMSNENLINFCSRVLQRYFPVHPEETTSETSTDSTQHSSLDDDPYQTHKMWLSVGVASVAMASYALINGLIKVNRNDDAQGDDDSDNIDDADYSFDN